ncbi:hypothetical protein WAX74_00870 [Psychrobacillus sp. FJAT-51614]|uniref:Uncharacterized protein n=1 Tax=Psychrobacillus mangrovi TaxID=3117745 RepID=A0ABU8EZM0_9BACI
MKNLLFVLIPFLFLFACQSNEENNEPNNQTVITTDKETKVEYETLSHFFQADQTTAQFKGEGNEYASYTLKTQHPYENYVITYEDNGGTIVQRIYRITEDNIGLLAETAEAYETVKPSLEELESMQVIDIYLAAPLEVGTHFNEWEIISTSETVETESQTFENVIVVEKTEAQGNITRKFFVKDFGEIKREFIMVSEDEEDITVTSTFQKLL